MCAIHPMSDTFTYMMVMMVCELGSAVAVLVVAAAAVADGAMRGQSLGNNCSVRNVFRCDFAVIWLRPFFGE